MELLRAKGFGRAPAGAAAAAAAAGAAAPVPDADFWKRHAAKLKELRAELADLLDKLPPV